MISGRVFDARKRLSWRGYLEDVIGFLMWVDLVRSGRG